MLQNAGGWEWGVYVTYVTQTLQLVPQYKSSSSSRRLPLDEPTCVSPISFTLHHHHLHHHQNGSSDPRWSNSLRVLPHHSGMSSHVNYTYLNLCFRIYFNLRFKAFGVLIK